MKAMFVSVQEVAEYTTILTRNGITFEVDFDVRVDRYVVTHTGGY
jgi:hypothetical protein